MSFSEVCGSIEVLARLGICADEAIEVAGRPLLVDLKRKSALLPMPSEPHHSNFPPTIPCRFFAYGRSFKVGHTFRTKNPRAKRPVEIEVFAIEVERELPYFKRRRVLALCQEAISGYLGESYFGHAYEVGIELVPKHFTKKELKRIETFRKQVQELCAK